MPTEISEELPDSELSGASSTSAATQKSEPPGKPTDDPPGREPNKAASAGQEHTHLNGEVSSPPILQVVSSSVHTSRPWPRYRESDLSKSWPGCEVPKMAADPTTQDDAGWSRRRTRTLSYQNGPALELTVPDKMVDVGGNGAALMVEQPEEGLGSAGGTTKEGDGKEGGEDLSRRRLRLRLMGSMAVALVFYITALISVVPVLSQYLLRRTVEDYLNLTNASLQQTPCASGQNGSVQQDLNWAQSHTSQQLLYFDLSEFLPSMLIALFIGSYADYIGRKLLVLAPVIGACLKSVVIFLVVYLEADMRFLYVGFVLEGLFGSFYVLSLGLFAAIADVTISSRQRVLLFGMVEISLAVAGAVSMIGTGFLIEAVGFVVPSLLLSGLHMIACVGIILWMPETLQDKPPLLVINPLFHLRNVFAFYYSEGSLHQRGLFICGQVILFFAVMLNLGRIPVETLFEMNSPLCWDSVQIGLFMGIRMLLQNLTSLLALKVLSRWIRIELIGMLGLVSGIAGFILQAMADTDLMMYISGTTGLLITTVSPVARTLLSRMAPRERQGALFASMSAAETICHLSASTIYNNVYAATLDVFTGAVFFLMAAFLIVDLALLILFTVLSRNMPHLQEVQIEVKILEPAASVASLPSSQDAVETTPVRSSTSSSGTYGRLRKGQSINGGVNVKDFCVLETRQTGEGNYVTSL